MLWLIAGILVFIIILFIPIRIKLTFLYQDNMIHVYLYNREFGTKKKVEEKEVNTKNVKQNQRNLDKLLPKDIRTTLINLSENKFKPKMKLLMELNFGFEDAALTAIMNGVLHSFSAVLYKTTGQIFNITGYEYIVKPQFNNPMLNIRIVGIISVNLAKILYMVFIIYFK